MSTNQTETEGVKELYDYLKIIGLGYNIFRQQQV